MIPKKESAGSLDTTTADSNNATDIIANDLSLVKDRTSEQIDREVSELISEACNLTQDVEQIVSILRAHCFKLGLDFDHVEPEIRAAIKNELAVLVRARRAEQREIARAIGSGQDAKRPTVVERITLADAITRFVLIKSMRSVYSMKTGAVYGLAEFNDIYVGSTHPVIGGNGRLKRVPVPVMWLKSLERMDVETVTWAPGRGQVTRDPEGNGAVNTWRAHCRIAPQQDWKDRSAVFVDHIFWLFGEYADKFLDWLAHIQQHPGQLPNFGWVHIALSHGLGRNWVASVLVRLWPGNVAASLDLGQMLETGFNARLSRALLAIVDEINEGGTVEWRHANALRQLITADRRLINPKYGRQHIEFNACRWLMFSNHTGALPLDEKDRRFFVVACEQTPKSEEYYTKLYANLEDRDFITSVVEFLAKRDVSTFNPGARPPMTEAKMALVNASKSEIDILAGMIARLWPVDVIYLDEINLLNEGDAPAYGARVSGKHMAYALGRAGIKRWGETGQIRGPGNATHRAYIIRNHSSWMPAIPADIRQEQQRCTKVEKDAAVFRDPDLVVTNSQFATAGLPVVET